MMLTLHTTHTPASDLAYLLHKHSERCQSFDLSFGRAHVYYPHVSADSCTACLLLDVDPVRLVRSDNDPHFALGQYVNDRPYVASSFLSVAIAQVFGTALQGRCREREELVTTPIPLEAKLDAIAVRGGERFLRAIFEPLGYTVDATRHTLDAQYPEWGESHYYSMTIRKSTTLSELLTHLYVLVPVFDNRKHYYVGADELEKLLAHGEGWLANHPEKDEISKRYLRFRSNLYRSALERLVAEESSTIDDDHEPTPTEDEPPSLNGQRLQTVLAELRASGAKRVVDLGCGEGKLMRELLADRQFQEIVGVDVSVRSLEFAARRLKLDRLPDQQANRVKLLHGSLMYRDQRIQGFDAASVVEVIEHLDPPRLAAFERVLFELAKPTTIVLTTPNREYNVLWPSLPAGHVRHADHRFEWTREEFQSWANRVATRFGYGVRFAPIGTVHPDYGSPTQMGVFTRNT